MTRCNVRQTHKTLQFLLSFNCYFINTCTDLYTDTKSNKQTYRHTENTHIHVPAYVLDWMDGKITTEINSVYNKICQTKKEIKIKTKWALVNIIFKVDKKC